MPRLAIGSHQRNGAKIPVPMKFRVVTLLCFLFAIGAFGTTYNVSTLADLQAKIDIAVDGDTIIVANRVYTASASTDIRWLGNSPCLTIPPPIERQPLIRIIPNCIVLP